MRLAVMYINGLGVDRCQSKGNYWLLKAAREGNLRANFMLRDMRYEWRNKKEKLSDASKELISESVTKMETLNMEEDEETNIKDKEKEKEKEPSHKIP